MPRPKRTKIVAAKPRLVQANKPVAATDDHHAAPTDSQPQSSAVLDKVSSDSDGLVTRSAALRNGTTRLSSHQGSKELLMRGALGSGDTVKAHHDESHMDQVRLDRRQELKRASIAVEGAADEKRTRRTTARTQAKTKSSQPNTKPSRASTAHNHNAPQDNPKPGAAAFSASQVPGTAPPSAQKVPGTPSFLSMARFKRRPRQNSLLTMVQQAAATRENSMIDGTGLAGDNDDNIDDDSLLTLGGLSAHPTPSAQGQPEARSSSSRKRKRGSEMQVAMSSPSPPSSPPTQHPQSAAKQQRQSDAAAPAPSSPSETAPSDQTAQLPPLHQHAPTAPGPRAQTTRARAPAPRPSRRPRTRRQRDPSPVLGTSPLSSPASTPPRAPTAPPTRKQVKPPPKNRRSAAASSTAALLALLPRRRVRPSRRRLQEFAILPDGVDAGCEDDTPSDLDSGSHSHSHSDEDVDVDVDADELSGRSRSRRRPGARALGERSAGTALAAANARSGQMRRRTYGRSAGDESLDAAGDESFVDAAGRAGKISAGKASGAKTGGKTGKASRDAGGREGDGGDEMAEAARKFAEVDEWEMSFESGSLGGASSPWR